MADPNILHAWRTLKRLKRAEAAERCGVKRQTWWRWETGSSRVDIELLSKVSEVTGIRREELRPDIFGEAA
jgi:transcriptional regulator with XRE-family HTH domain